MGLRKLASTYTLSQIYTHIDRGSHRQTMSDGETDGQRQTDRETE